MDLYEFMCTSCGISHHMEIGPANLGYAKDLQREVDLTRPCPNCGGELMVIGPKDLEPFYRTTPKAP